MVLIVICGLNGQNNEGESLFDKRSTNREKMGRGKCLIKEFQTTLQPRLHIFYYELR